MKQTAQHPLKIFKMCLKMKIIPLQSNFLWKSARQSMSTQKKETIFMNYKDFTDSRVFMRGKKNETFYKQWHQSCVISQDLIFLCESLVQRSSKTLKWKAWTLESIFNGNYMIIHHSNNFQVAWCISYPSSFSCLMN